MPDIALSRDFSATLSVGYNLDTWFLPFGASRVQQRTAATNLAVVRRLALNLVKQEPTEMSLAKKRFAAALDTDYLEKILYV